VFLNGSAMVEWRGRFIDSRHRQFVKWCLPWCRHRLLWHVYMVDFLPSTMDNLIAYNLNEILHFPINLIVRNCYLIEMSRFS
jgi:hypothetical protein